MPKKFVQPQWGKSYAWSVDFSPLWRGKFDLFDFSVHFLLWLLWSHCYFMHFCAHFASLPQPHFLTSTSLLYCLWAVMDYPSQLYGSLSAAWLAYYLAMSLLLHQLQDYPPSHFHFFFALSTAVPLLPAPLPTIVLHILFFPHPLHLLHHPLHPPGPAFPPFSHFWIHLWIFFYGHVHSILYTMYIHH